MYLKELIDKTISSLDRGMDANVISVSEHELLVGAWVKLKSWVYPQLITDDMQLVTRCKRCRYYKRYKKKDNPKAVPFYACSRTKIKRDPDFFCKEGELK